MTREEKIDQLEAELVDGKKLFFLLKHMFLNNLNQLPDEQVDQFLTILSQYETPIS